MITPQNQLKVICSCSLCDSVSCCLKDDRSTNNRWIFDSAYRATPKKHLHAKDEELNCVSAASYKSNQNYCQSRNERLLNNLHQDNQLIAQEVKNTVNHSCNSEENKGAQCHAVENHSCNSKENKAVVEIVYEDKNGSTHYAAGKSIPINFKKIEKKESFEQSYSTEKNPPTNICGCHHKIIDCPYLPQKYTSYLKDQKDNKDNTNRKNFWYTIPKDSNNPNHRNIKPDSECCDNKRNSLSVVTEVLYPVGSYIKETVQSLISNSDNNNKKLQNIANCNSKKTENKTECSQIIKYPPYASCMQSAEQHVMDIVPELFNKSNVNNKNNFRCHSDKYKCFKPCNKKNVQSLSNRCDKVEIVFEESVNYNFNSKKYPANTRSVVVDNGMEIVEEASLEKLMYHCQNLNNNIKPKTSIKKSEFSEVEIVVENGENDEFNPIENSVIVDSIAFGEDKEIVVQRSNTYSINNDKELLSDNNTDLIVIEEGIVFKDEKSIIDSTNKNPYSTFQSVNTEILIPETTTKRHCKCLDNGYVTLPDNSNKKQSKIQNANVNITNMVLERMREAYAACSCKYCQCSEQQKPTLKNDVCDCKPCSCVDCKHIQKQYNVFNAAGTTSLLYKSSTLRKANERLVGPNAENCNCKPCECAMCASMKHGLNSKPTAEGPTVDSKATTQLCTCGSCQCAPCMMHIKPTTTDATTGINLHPYCACDLSVCTEETCAYDLCDSCRCTRKHVMQKPMSKVLSNDNLNIGITGRKKNPSQTNKINQIMYTTVTNRYPTSIGAKRITEPITNDGNVMESYRSIGEHLSNEICSNLNCNNLSFIEKPLENCDIRGDYKKIMVPESIGNISKTKALVIQNENSTLQDNRLPNLMKRLSALIKRCKNKRRSRCHDFNRFYLAPLHKSTSTISITSLQCDVKKRKLPFKLKSQYCYVNKIVQQNSETKISHNVFLNDVSSKCNVNKYNYHNDMEVLQTGESYTIIEKKELETESSFNLSFNSELNDFYNSFIEMYTPNHQKLRDMYEDAKGQTVELLKIYQKWSQLSLDLVTETDFLHK